MVLTVVHARHVRRASKQSLLPEEFREDFCMFRRFGKFLSMSQPISLSLPDFWSTDTYSKGTVVDEKQPSASVVLNRLHALFPTIMALDHANNPV